MKSILLNLLIALVIGAVICVAAGAVYLHREYSKPLNLEMQVVEIPKGASVGAISQILNDHNIVHDPLLFKVFTRLYHDATALHAGEYEIAAGASIKDILAALEQGKTFQRFVTIPEGLTSWQIVQLLQKQLPVEEGQDIAIPKEGSLMPDTYAYSTIDTSEDVLKRMAVSMQNYIDTAWEARPEDSYVQNKDDLITLASIVEKETAVPTEYAKVAGVFVNRLKQGMALQTDPTVIYALTKGKIQQEGLGPLGRRLLSKDLEVDDPYNTYKYAGLPPSPICNPGKQAIDAVLNPESHDYIYFVADGTGGHAFAKTLAEHNDNVAKWRKIRKQSGL